MQRRFSLHRRKERGGVHRGPARRLQRTASGSSPSCPITCGRAGDVPSPEVDAGGCGRPTACDGVHLWSPSATVTFGTGGGAGRHRRHMYFLRQRDALHPDGATTPLPLTKPLAEGQTIDRALDVCPDPAGDDVHAALEYAPALSMNDDRSPRSSFSHVPLPQPVAGGVLVGRRDLEPCTCPTGDCPIGGPRKVCHPRSTVAQNVCTADLGHAIYCGASGPWWPMLPGVGRLRHQAGATEAS
jgi:hypothetical protein